MMQLLRSSVSKRIDWKYHFPSNIFASKRNLLHWVVKFLVLHTWRPNQKCLVFNPRSTTSLTFVKYPLNLNCSALFSTPTSSLSLWLSFIFPVPPPPFCSSFLLLHLWHLHFPSSLTPNEGWRRKTKVLEAGLRHVPFQASYVFRFFLIFRLIFIIFFVLGVSEVFRHGSRLLGGSGEANDSNCSCSPNIKLCTIFRYQPKHVY